MKTFCIYIMANKSGTLYVGITSNIKKRVSQHRNKLISGFTAKYNITRLLYFESIQDPDSAIAREKQIKPWRRARKLNLIKSQNPDLSDLSADWFD